MGNGGAECAEWALCRAVYVIMILNWVIIQRQFYGIVIEC